MNQNTGNPYMTPSYELDPIAAAAATDERVRFIRNTYLHLAGAVFAFVMLQLVLFNLFPQAIEKMTGVMVGTRYGWLIVLGLFMAVSYIAERWAMSDTSKSMQYAGLGLFIVAEAVIFVPILYIANLHYPGAIQSAGIVTMIVFAGLSAVALVTKADFSFMRYALYLGGLAAMAAIAVSFFVQADFLGTWFTWAMIVLASGYILYHTSNILHHYRTDQYVAAALALFSSVALLFWYILQLFMSRD
jgi:FtsH-binding integral membrane protein